MKRLLSIVLSLAMVLCMMPAFALTALAEETTQEKADRIKTELETEKTFYVTDMDAVNFINEVYSKAEGSYLPNRNGDMLPYATGFESKFTEAGFSYLFSAKSGDGFDDVAWNVGGTVDIKDESTTYATTSKLLFNMVQLVAVDSSTDVADIPSTIESNIKNSLGIDVTVTEGETVEAFLSSSMYPQGLDYYIQKAHVEDNLYTITINGKDYKFFVTKESIGLALGTEKEKPGQDGNPYFDDTNKILYTNNNNAEVYETEEAGYDANVKITVSGIQSDYLLPEDYSICAGSELENSGNYLMVSIYGGYVKKLILASRYTGNNNISISINGGIVDAIRLGDIYGGDRQAPDYISAGNNAGTCTPTIELGYDNSELINSAKMNAKYRSYNFSGSYTVPDEVKAVKRIYINGESNITFHANGGTFDGGVTEISKFGTKDTAPTPSKENAEFMGWALSADAAVPDTTTAYSVNDYYAVYKDDINTKPFSVSERNGKVTASFNANTNSYQMYAWQNINIEDLDVVADIYTKNDNQEIVRVQKEVEFGENVSESDEYELYLATIKSYSKEGTYENYTIYVRKGQSSKPGIYVNASFAIQGDNAYIYHNVYESDGEISINVPESTSTFNLNGVYVFNDSGTIIGSPINEYTLDATTTEIPVQVQKSDQSIVNYTIRIIKSSMTELDSKIASERNKLDAIDANEKTVKIANLDGTGIHTWEEAIGTHFSYDVLKNWGAAGCNYSMYEDAQGTVSTWDYAFNEKRYVKLSKQVSYKDGDISYSINVSKSDLVPFTLVHENNLDNTIINQIKADDTYLNSITGGLTIATYRDEDKLEDFILSGIWYSSVSEKLRQTSDFSEANPELYSKLKGDTELEIKMTSYGHGGGCFSSEYSIGLNYYKGDVSYGLNSLDNITKFHALIQSIIDVPVDTTRSNAAAAATAEANEYLNTRGYTASVTEVTPQEMFAGYFSVSINPEYRYAERAYVIEEGFALYSGEEGTTEDEFIGVYKHTTIYDMEGLNLVTGETLDYLNINGTIQTGVKTYQPYYISAEGLTGGYLLLNKDKEEGGCVHTLKHHAAQASTCETKGNIEYWECTSCDKLYSDENCDTEITKEDTYIPLVRHSWDSGTVLKEASTTTQGEVEYECTECHAKKTEALEVIAKAEKETLSDSSLSDELKENKNLDTAAKVESAMTDAAKQQDGFENAEVSSFELNLSVSTNNGGKYEEATSENVPEDGVAVTIPYPEGKDSSYNYIIIHMYDKAVGNHEAGDIEVYDSPVKTADGLKVVMNSASPVQIASTPGDGTYELNGAVHGYYGTGNVEYELIPGLSTLKTKKFASKLEDFSFTGLAGGQYTLKVCADGDYVAREYSIDIEGEKTFDVAIHELGDANMDGVRSAEDITRLARHVAKISIESDDYAILLFNTDRSTSGSTAAANVDAADITHLARFVAKIIEEL